ncbi:MAG: ROK family glucokinase [Clostridiales bacterium]|nr:ROK family glucokinase [Clostridiales bacterium]
MERYGFGVDIGGTTCKIGFFDSKGVMLDKWEIKTNTENSGVSILDDIAREINIKLTQEKIDKDRILGIGIGVPGPVMSDGTVNQCVNLGWGVFNVEKEMERKTGIRVKAANDANIAALGEMWQGGATGYSNIVMITLGTGVGGGIVIEGKILSGAEGAGGELGHISVNDTETESCSCGKKGCLEQYASATGIVRMARKKLLSKHVPTILEDKTVLTAKDIFDAAKKGDDVSCELVKELGEVLGTALATIACVVNPEIFIFGGGVSNAGNILLDVTRKSFSNKTFHICRKAKFALAKLGNDAGIYGGMRLVMEER